MPASDRVRRIGSLAADAGVTVGVTPCATTSARASIPPASRTAGGFELQRRNHAPPRFIKRARSGTRISARFRQLVDPDKRALFRNARRHRQRLADVDRASRPTGSVPYHAAVRSRSLRPDARPLQQRRLSRRAPASRRQARQQHAVAVGPSRRAPCSDGHASPGSRLNMPPAWSIDRRCTRAGSS